MTRTRAARWALIAGLLGACQDDPIGFSELRGELVLSPTDADFGEVPLQVEERQTFTLANEGTGSLRVETIAIDSGDAVEGLTLSGAGIFRVESFEGAEVLPPGGAREFVVVGQPTEELSYRSRVVVRTDAGDEVSAILRLLGVPQPPCDDDNPCTENRFDPESNQCVVAFADGTSCQPADRCIINGVCARGVCRGESKVCEDDDVCTRDVCRQSDGQCVFLEDTSRCDDDNPCTVDSCGPDGCIHEPILNGEPCDDGNECTVNDACFGGSCLGADLADGAACDDGDSCTVNTSCVGGSCVGDDVVEIADEGEVVFNFVLPSAGFQRAFLHRREMSLSNDGVLVGLDHRTEPGGSFQHVVFGMKQCGTSAFEYRYRPPDPNALVRYVRRALQIDTKGHIQVIVGVRQLPENGYRPETTSFELKPDGTLCLPEEGDVCRRGRRIKAPGGETGWSLTPDGSQLSGVVVNPNDSTDPSRDVFTILREDRDGNILWQHNRLTRNWAELLGVAGPRVLFWSSGRFGALDFATGAQVWSRQTPFIPKEMALSTELDLGLARTGQQVIAVQLLSGDEIFRFPDPIDERYAPRTDPVISSDGRILLMMERYDPSGQPVGLEWVELTLEGEVASSTPLPYQHPADPTLARHEDFFDDPYPTVADDGITYVGYGDSFWALNPGGGIRWTLTSTTNGFTGTVPLLRDDGVLLLSTTSREIVGVKTNGAAMDTEAWSSFRNDTRRTNYTP